MNVKKRLLDGPRMNRAIRRMAIEVVEKNRGLEDLLIVGIRSRGVPIGERMAKEIAEMEGQQVPFGTDLLFAAEDLADFILHIEVCEDFWAPQPPSTLGALLVDRGHRELPIHADVIGKTVPTDANEVIKVKLAETDDEDEVLIMEK